MKKYRYKSKWFDIPLYAGTKRQMEQSLKESKMTTETHVIKKIPFIKCGSKSQYGIFRKKGK